MLKLFMFLPFIFALFLGISKFLKNPIYIRGIAKFFFTVQFLLSIPVLFGDKNIGFTLFNVDFILDGFSSCMIFLSSFIFFLFSIISKTFITKLHRLFYSTSLLFLGLINLTLLTDNIFALLAFLFWIFLVNYFLSTSFFKNKEDKKNTEIQLANDLFWFFIANALIIKDFGKYFIINNESFNFSNLAQNLYNIPDESIILAFFGFLILIGRLFNMIPFCAKNLSNSTKINPVVFSLNNINFLIIGCCLFLKCYLNFDYLFYQVQGNLAIFFLLNFIIFAILVLRQKRLFKFLTNLLGANIIIGLLSVFAFEKECFSIFAYYIFVLSISYLLCSTIFMILADKFKTDNIEEFSKIEDKTRLTQIFTTISLLNIASVPLFSFFSAELICLMMIFSTDFDETILNFAPYCLIAGVFILALCTIGVLYKILIEPSVKSKIQIKFCNHQILVCLLLVFVIILLGIYPDFVLNQINSVIQIENF